VIYVIGKQTLKKGFTKGFRSKGFKNTLMQCLFGESNLSTSQRDRVMPNFETFTFEYCRSSPV